jgi:hypothetical protein
MPDTRVRWQRADGGFEGPHSIRSFWALGGFWTTNWTLPGNQYNASQYVHEWYFYSYRRVSPDATWYNAATANGTTYLHDDQVIGLGGTVTLFMWNNETWDYSFALYNVRGVHYTITYHPNGGGGGAYNQHPQFGSGYHISGNPFGRTGYYFAYWQINELGNYSQNQYYGGWNQTRNFNAYAIWGQNTYTISYFPNGGTGDAYSQYPVYDNGYTISGNPFGRTGYSFSYWQIDYLGNYSQNQYYGGWNRTSNYNAYAIWTQNTYTITYHPNGGSGNAYNQNPVYDNGYTISGNSFSRTGYSFSYWQIDYLGNYSQSQYYGVWRQTSNYNAYAIWYQNTYTITYYPNGGAQGAYNQNPVYDNGYTISGNSFTRTGYYFSYWRIDYLGNYSQSQYYGTWRQTSNYNAYAEWGQNTYTITYHPNGGTGNAYNQNPVYDNGYYISGNSFTRTGYSFSYWQIDYLGNYNQNQYYGGWNMTSNYNAYAIWTINQYSITFTANGQGTGRVLTQNYNTTVTCPPLKAVGYVFSGWATSVQNATNKIVARATNSTFTLGAASETFFAIWTENVSPTTKFTDLETVFGRKGTAQISISEYRAESGQTTANSRINFVTNFKGKGLAPP